MTRVNTDEIEFTNDYTYQWKGRPFSGIGFELGDDGRVISEIEFNNGMQNGTARSYYSTGGVRREAQYENNTLHGFVRDWNEDGVLQSEEEYERGVCVRRKARDLGGELSLCYELSENDPQFEILVLLRNAKFTPPPS